VNSQSQGGNCARGAQSRDTTLLARPIEYLLLLAQVVFSREIDDTGDVVLLESVEIGEAWAALRAVSGRGAQNR